MVSKKTSNTENKKVTKSVKARATKSKASKASKISKASKASKGSKTSHKKAQSKKGGKVKEDKNTRFFKLVDEKTGKAFGRYTGGTPKQAASKGYTKMIQKAKANGEKVPHNTRIYLRESTRGSAKKTYGYKATRDKLDEPQQLVIQKAGEDDKVITYKFRNRITKAAVPEFIGGAPTKKVAKKSTKKSSTAKKSSGAKKSTSTKKAPQKKSTTKKSGSKTAAKKAPQKKPKKTSGSKTNKKSASSKTKKTARKTKK